ncbi:Carbohydrate-binding CenC-like protein [Dioscorea alata]|uniref:Carbohydrate-binding CenC-like protein n=1 Tax=Dioscorea alata TaxID=55571 RepID=A0ACB7UVY3_DIOAL|nr:Carbohydrate-binding CenC-like protein [Dioscorea alata]
MRRWASSLVLKGRKSSGKAHSQPEAQEASHSMAESQRNDQHTDGYELMLKAMECNTTRLEALEQRISALEKIINGRFDALLEFLIERIPESLKLSASSAPLEIASPQEPDEKMLTQESKSKFHDMIGEQPTSHANNIISNHDFSRGLDTWHPNSCHAYVASRDSGLLKGITANSGGCYAVVTRRTQIWQGLEQDITGKVSVCSTYTVSAFVRVCGNLQQSTRVQATLKLEHADSPTSYLSVGSASVSEECWVKLEGSFSLPNLPKRVVFYLEGPPPGVDLLIDSVIVSSSSMTQIEDVKERCASEEDEGILKNPHFESGLNHWSGRGCKLVLHDSLEHRQVLPLNGNFFVSATYRSQTWNGIQQDITGKVKRKVAYEVTAVVRVYGAANADVHATL